MERNLVSREPRGSRPNQLCQTTGERCEALLMSVVDPAIAQALALYDNPMTAVEVRIVRYCSNARKIHILTGK